MPGLFKTLEEVKNTMMDLFVPKAPSVKSVAAVKFSEDKRVQTVLAEQQSKYDSNAALTNRMWNAKMPNGDPIYDESVVDNFAAQSTGEWEKETSKRLHPDAQINIPDDVKSQVRKRRAGEAPSGAFMTKAPNQNDFKVKAATENVNATLLAMKATSGSRKWSGNNKKPESIPDYNDTREMMMRLGDAKNPLSENDWQNVQSMGIQDSSLDRILQVRRGQQENVMGDLVQDAAQWTSADDALNWADKYSTNPLVAGFAKQQAALMLQDKGVSGRIQKEDEFKKNVAMEQLRTQNDLLKEATKAQLVLAKDYDLELRANSVAFRSKHPMSDEEWAEFTKKVVGGDPDARATWGSWSAQEDSYMAAKSGRIEQKSMSDAEKAAKRRRQNTAAVEDGMLTDLSTKDNQEAFVSAGGSQALVDAHSWGSDKSNVPASGVASWEASVSQEEVAKDALARIKEAGAGGSTVTSEQMEKALNEAYDEGAVDEATRATSRSAIKAKIAELSLAEAKAFADSRKASNEEAFGTFLDEVKNSVDAISKTPIDAELSASIDEMGKGDRDTGLEVWLMGQKQPDGSYINGRLGDMSAAQAARISVQWKKIRAGQTDKAPELFAALQAASRVYNASRGMKRAELDKVDADIKARTGLRVKELDRVVELLKASVGPNATFASSADASALTEMQGRTAELANYADLDNKRIFTSREGRYLYDSLVANTDPGKEILAKLKPVMQDGYAIYRATDIRNAMRDSGIVVLGGQQPDLSPPRFTNPDSAPDKSINRLFLSETPTVKAIINGDATGLYARISPDAQVGLQKATTALTKLGPNKMDEFNINGQDELRSELKKAKVDGAIADIIVDMSGDPMIVSMLQSKTPQIRAGVAAVALEKFAAEARHRSTADVAAVLAGVEDGDERTMTVARSALAALLVNDTNMKAAKVGMVDNEKSIQSEITKLDDRIKKLNPGYTPASIAPASVVVAEATKMADEAVRIVESGSNSEYANAALGTIPGIETAYDWEELRSTLHDNQMAEDVAKMSLAAERGISWGEDENDPSSMKSSGDMWYDEMVEFKGEAAADEMVAAQVQIVREDARNVIRQRVATAATKSGNSAMRTRLSAKASRDKMEEQAKRLLKR